MRQTFIKNKDAQMSGTAAILAVVGALPRHTSTSSQGFSVPRLTK